MAVEIKVPAVGQSITEGTIARWLKPNGAAVNANEPACEVDTDKATTEVPLKSRVRFTPSRKLPNPLSVLCGGISLAAIGTGLIYIVLPPINPL